MILKFLFLFHSEIFRYTVEWMGREGIGKDTHDGNDK